tara:strand:+ start:6567 stop:6746 length:180 start_codon:yes stop_codon:yes gene_type:complete
MDKTINNFKIPAIIDHDSLKFGFFPVLIIIKAPTEETRTASKGFMDIMVSIRIFNTSLN